MDGRHAQGHGAVLADHGDSLVHLGALGPGELGDVAVDPADEPPDPGDLLLGGGGVGAGPLLNAVDGGGEPFRVRSRSSR